MSITPLTRTTFIAANHVQIALSQKTMYELVESEEGVKEVHIPESFKKSGIPQGYSVGAFPSCLYHNDGGNSDYLIVCRDRLRFRSSNGGSLPCQVWYYHGGVCILDSFFRMIISAMSRQLPDGMLEELQDVINVYTNLNIIPTSVHEQAGGILPPSHSNPNLFLQKRAIEDASLAEDDAKEK